MAIGGITSEMGREQFLQLLVTQLRNQNPLDPIKDEAFVAQLAQFSTLEGVEQLNASFSDLLALQQLTQGTNLLGKVAVFELPDGVVGRGVVEGVLAQEGKLLLQIDGIAIPLDRVRGLANPRFGGIA